MDYNIDQNGYYGDFGGAYIPEMLYPNIFELKQKYISIINDISFKKEFNQLLEEYVGRPTPLYFAKRLSKKYNMRTIYFAALSNVSDSLLDKNCHDVSRFILPQRSFWQELKLGEESDLCSFCNRCYRKLVL